MDTALGMELPLGTMLVSLFCALIFLIVFFAMNANRHVYSFFMVFFVGKSHQFDMAASFPCALSYFLFLVATGHEHSKWILILFSCYSYTSFTFPCSRSLRLFQTLPSYIVSFHFVCSPLSFVQSRLFKGHWLLFPLYSTFAFPHCLT